MEKMNLEKMKLLPLMCLFVLMWTEQTFADGTLKVKEDEVVVLNCSFDNTDMTNKKFDWKKDGEDFYFYENGTDVKVASNIKPRVTHFQESLKSGNVSIRIKPVTVQDSGTYTCIYPDPKKKKTYATIQLEVGTCPKPNVRALNRSKNIVLVECKADRAFPEPEIELQNSNNETIPENKTEYFDNGTIILTAEVTKEDFYTCVVRQQPPICHEIRSDPNLLGVPGASGVLQLSSGLLLLPLFGLLKELFSVWP
ncbi:selection and upkeep of intraepithelial T-cells protein 3 isoform X2 [Austrofundulus limnaeus]|uniref:Selection and upkeep of intraepithelial T-cells protein 3 isoform X2 n=1 Tax=Austrofundulus limnaeus TaxID=52670 RepID=A0A2I4BUU0_AUSLI|nr:PREDICTED: selection and upkeep of intraepithelial T-cells protein 3-like isoform X2 [Austrofundulus limnaeus]